MRRVLLISLLLTGALLAASTLTWDAAHAGREGRRGAPGVTGQAGGYDGFGRTLSAPFRAIAKLFGGKKEAKPRRAGGEAAGGGAAARTAADGVPPDFESAPAVRVTDAVTAAASAPRAGETAAELVVRAREQLGRGALNEAVALLSHAAALDPAHAEARGLLGVALDRKGMPQAARQSFDQALDLAPADAQTLNNLGYYLYRQGRYKDAVKHLKHASKLAPRDEKIWNNLALAQCRLGKYGDAYRSFARAVGEFRARMNVGNLLERAGRDEDALKHFEEARRLDPTSRIALQHLADVYQRLGRWREAEAARQALATPQTGKAVAGGGGR